jgi:nucleotide-binding universal stress UspA family protein
MKLLIAVDFSTSFDAIIAYTRRLGALLNARIWLLHVAIPNPELAGFQVASQTLRDSAAKEFHEEHRHLQRAADELRQAGLDCVALLVQGSAATTILAEAEKLDIDMIVLGSYGKGTMKKLILGSTGDEVIRTSTIPVLVVPPYAHKAMPRGQ